MKPGKEFARDLDKIRLWDGAPLAPGLRARLAREFERMRFLGQQVRELEQERLEALRHSTQPELDKVRNLLRVKGIGINGAWLYTMELFAWREIRSRRELGALAGLTQTPHQSGDDSRELGIGMSGNRYIRTIAIELAWDWLRYQPTASLPAGTKNDLITGAAECGRLALWLLREGY